MSYDAPYPTARKSLGQHWLDDAEALQAMVDSVVVTPDDTVLEVGPGPGTLTKRLVEAAARVVAVEFDERLADALPGRVPAGNLDILRQDILRYDLTALPPDYLVVANIPYYLTSNLIRILSESSNPPARAALLVQKEVAQRVCAAPGALSVLSVTAQFYWRTKLGRIVKSDLFVPPPKVDSQILILERHAQPLFPDVVPKQFFRLVKAGFGERRKTLRNSLSGGLHLDKADTEALLAKAGIEASLRAQNLTLEQWHSLYRAYELTA